MVERWVGTALSSFMSLLTITLAYLTGARAAAVQRACVEEYHATMAIVSPWSDNGSSEA